MKNILIGLVIIAVLGGCGGHNDVPQTSDCKVISGSSITNYSLTDQWHLGRDGINIGGVWPTIQGAGVIVAVLDDAVELSHPYIGGAIVDGSYSYRVGNEGGAPTPCASSDSHGTAVAGIISGRSRGLDTPVGVAPRSSIVAYDVLQNPTLQNLAYALTRDNSRVAIYNSSWGSRDTGAIHSFSDIYETAIKSGINNGRGGLGSIFVSAAGNGGPYDNSNLDGYVNKRGVIAVCGVDRRGKRLPESEPGANILVCAPGEGIVTSSLNGTYRGDFRGTSAAAPQISGVVALMLSVRPDLSWRDVQLILASSARKNDPNDSEWRSANGGGGWVHPYYGYGVVDATRAIELTKTWPSRGGTTNQKSCSITTAVDRVISGRLDSTVAFECSQITSIEFVEISVTIIHASSGDLRLEIIGTTGYSSVLADKRSCNTSCGQYSNWKFGSVHQQGERADGSWTLRITDAVLKNPGVLKSWQLTVYGS